MSNELNNKQHIIEKLLNINGNQSKVNDINVIDNAMSIKIIVRLNITKIKIKVESQTQILIKEIHQKRK